MQVNYSYKAMRWLDEAPLQLRKRIIDKICFYSFQDDPISFAKYIPEKMAYRFRIGDYRAIFTIENNLLKVAKIERRDKAYD